MIIVGLLKKQVLNMQVNLPKTKITLYSYVAKKVIVV